MIRSRHSARPTWNGLIFALLLLAPPVATAQPVQMVGNGGFEDAFDFNGWGVKRAFTGSLLVCSADPATAHSGNRAALFGAHEGQPDVLSKSFATEPGQSYQVSFWLASDNIAPVYDGFLVLWDDQVLLDLSNPQNGFPYTQYRYNVVAVDYSARLTIQGYKRFGTFRIDDVGVTIAPGSNNCSDAPQILLDGVYHGSTVGATPDGSSPSCGLLGGADVWYRIFSPCAGATVQIDTCGSSFDTVVSIHQGTCGAVIACNDDNNGLGPCPGGNSSYLSVTFPSAGVYSLRIAGFSAFSQGSYVLRLQSNAPTNDRCSQAQPVALGENVVGDTTCSSIETLSGTACGLPLADRWYSYTPSCDHLLRVDTCGSAINTVVGLYGGACDSLEELACNDNAPAGTPCGPSSASYLEYPVQAGVRYLVRVGNGFSAPGAYELHLSSTTPTPYTCETAIVVGDGPTAFDARCAGGTASRFCNDPPVNQPGVWFRYTATCTGEAAVSICDAEIPAGGRLSVFAGECGSLVCIGSADLSNMGVCPAETEAILFDAFGFESYYICYSQPAGGAYRPATLHLRSVRPIDDLCVDATPIGDGSYTGSTECALPDGVVSCGSALQSPSVWYRWTATCNSQLTIDTCDSTYDTVLSVYRGSCASLQELACDDDGAGCGPAPLRRSRISIPVLANESYLIRVSGFNGGRGDYVLNVQSTSPGNPECYAATAIAAGVTNIDGRCATGAGGRFCNTPVDGPGLWFAYTPTCSGTKRLEVCRRAGAPSALLSAYTGACGSLTCIASANAALPQFCPAATEALVFEATAHDTVLICYTQFPGTPLGELQLRVIEDSPAGDACVEASPLVLGSNVESVGCARADADAPACAPGMPGRWYSYLPVEDGRLMLDTCNSPADTAIAVFEGDCGQLALIECQSGFDAGGPCPGTDDTHVDVPVVAATPYRIWVGISGGDEISVNAAFEPQSAGRLGDMNCDGIISVGDIGPFVLALTNPAQYAAQWPSCNLMNADTNQNGVVSVTDIGPFVLLVVQGG